MAGKAPTKSEMYKSISDKTGVSRKDVKAVFDELNVVVAKALKKNGPQQIALPGLCKIVVRKKPAQKEGVRPNPFKPGEMMTVKAKPARNIVKIRPLKALKDMV